MGAAIACKTLWLEMNLYDVLEHYFRARKCPRTAADRRNRDTNLRPMNGQLLYKHRVPTSVLAPNISCSIDTLSSAQFPDRRQIRSTAGSSEVKLHRGAVERVDNSMSLATRKSKPRGGTETSA